MRILDTLNTKATVNSELYNTGEVTFYLRELLQRRENLLRNLEVAYPDSKYQTIFTNVRFWHKADLR